MRTRLVTTVLWTLLFGSAIAFPSASAACARPLQSDAEAELARAIVAELGPLAEWCAAEKLLGSRLATYEAILAFEPDHADARRILGWRRGSDGEWQRARPARSRRDRTGLEEELAARRAAIVERALGECERLAAALGDAALARTYAQLVTLAPEHARLRELLGQARHPNGAWARADAVRALARSEARLAQVTALRSALGEPERLDANALDPEATQASVKWISVARTSRGLVAGTVPFAEAMAIAIAVHITPDVAREALPPLAVPLVGAQGHPPVGDGPQGHPGWWSQPRFYIVQASRDRDALIAKLGAELEPRKAQLLRTVNTGFLDKRNSIGVWTASPADRLEAAVRQRVGLYLQRTFGVGSEQGWIWEGIGLLLSGAVTGTKNLVYIRLQPTDRTVAANGRKATDWQLFGPGVDWLALARDLLREKPHPNLGLLLGKDVNAMTKEDLLLAHALGAWLVDGHVGVAPRVLGRIGAGQPPVAVLEEELGLKLPEVPRELLAWLEDVRPSE